MDHYSNGLLVMKLAIYIRVSTIEQSMNGYSLDAQEAKTTAYCESHGYDYQIYKDAGKSATKTRNRPAYKQMMKDIDTWDGILITKLDRLSRSRTDFFKAIDILRDKKKELISLGESIDTSSANGRFVLSIFASLAQMESEQLSERTRIGQREKAKQGLRIQTTKALYGYTVHKSGTMNIKESEAKVIRLIFKLYTEHRSMDEIAIILNNDKSIKRKFYAKTVRQVLRNPTYAGWLKWGDIIYKHDHPAIVSVETFNKAQDRIKYKKGKPLYLGDNRE